MFFIINALFKDRLSIAEKGMLVSGDMPAGQPLTCKRKPNELQAVKLTQAQRIKNKFGIFNGGPGDYALKTERGDIVLCPATEFDVCFEEVFQQPAVDPGAPAPTNQNAPASPADQPATTPAAPATPDPNVASIPEPK